jgi:RNA polymerase sigma-70 factor, ECF subfamily
MSLTRRTRRRAVALLGLAREPVVEADPLNRLALVEALNRLPARYRVVLTMHYLVDLPIREVADELGLPVATVRTRLARGRRRLNEELTLEIVPQVPRVTEVFRA